MASPRFKKRRRNEAAEDAPSTRSRSKRRATLGAEANFNAGVVPHSDLSRTTEPAPSAKSDDGKLDTLEGAPGTSSPVTDVWIACVTAATLGDIDSLRRLTRLAHFDPERTVLWALVALKEGHFQVAEWIYEQEPSILRSVCLMAAQEGRLDLLKWARARNPAPTWDPELSNAVVMAGCEFGTPEVAKWGVLQSPAMMCPRTCLIAVVTGNLPVLQWLRGLAPPCPWSAAECVLGALDRGRFDVVKWVREQSPTVEIDVCRMSAEEGRVDLLKLARAQEPPFRWGPSVCLTAALRGHLEALQWMRGQEPPCPWIPSDCAEYAAEKGHLEVLKWVSEQAPETRASDSVCWKAAYWGRLDVLQWARAQDPAFEWGKNVTEYAASRGHLEILQWLRKQAPPCPWDATACAITAAHRGDLEIVQWLKTQDARVAKELTHDWLGTCVWSATFSHVRASDEDIIRFLQAEPRLQMGRDYQARIVQHDRVELFRFLVARGDYRYSLRPGLQNAGPLCARLARQLMIPLDAKSQKRASEVFKRQIAISLGLRKHGIFGDVAQKISNLAGMPWI